MSIFEKQMTGIMTGIFKKADYPDYKIPSGCAVFGILNEAGAAFGGSDVIEGIAMMHDRSNGLGGGFAAYGIYPDYKNDRAFHVIYDDINSKKQAEEIFKNYYKILYYEEIPTKRTANINNAPLIFRYFLKLKEGCAADGFISVNPAKNRFGSEFSEENFTADFVMKVNSDVSGTYIISSGKNMGIFKGVGFPEDIGEFFRLDEYKAYLWTSHGRFPTNSPGWWGGSHPFGLLGWSVVHNGEISSYGRNKRFVDSFGYNCSLSVDTEVIAYLFDLLVRKNNIDIEIVSLILASPLWEQIERMPEADRQLAKTLRILFGGALINGPFSIIVGHNDFMYALNDRVKLRPMVAARKDDLLFVSSEESAIRKVCKTPDRVWHPEGGMPVIGFVKNSGSTKNNMQNGSNGSNGGGRAQNGSSGIGRAQNGSSGSAQNRAGGTLKEAI
jgi:glutamate synthase domain-containing protein 1